MTALSLVTTLGRSLACRVLLRCALRIMERTGTKLGWAAGEAELRHKLTVESAERGKLWS